VGLAATLLAPAAMPSPASSLPLDSCRLRDGSKAFAAWGDPRSYFLFPGGSFESDARQWTFVDGSTVVRGNETYFVRSATDRRSAHLTYSSSTISPTICVSMGEAWVRLFVKNPGVAGSFLHIQAFVQDRLTGLVLSTGFDVRGDPDSTDWSPSPAMLVPNLLGGVTGTQNLTLVFTPTGAPAEWGIDDVLVDPFKSR
jgi:hypothetical protein